MPYSKLYCNHLLEVQCEGTLTVTFEHFSLQLYMTFTRGFNDCELPAILKAVWWHEILEAGAEQAGQAHVTELSGERKHRAEMPSLVAGDGDWTAGDGRDRPAYRDNSDLQTSTHVAVADRPSATSHHHSDHHHPPSHHLTSHSSLSSIPSKLF